MQTLQSRNALSYWRITTKCLHGVCTMVETLYRWLTVIIICQRSVNISAKMPYLLLVGCNSVETLAVFSAKILYLKQLRID